MKLDSTKPKPVLSSPYQVYCQKQETERARAWPQLGAYWREIITPKRP